MLYLLSYLNTSETGGYEINQLFYNIRTLRTEE